MSLKAKSSLRFKTGGYQEVGYLPLPDDLRIRKVLQAIKADPTQDIANLASLVNLSCSRLSHLFKGATGVSLQSFLTSCRLEIAEDLLRSTEMPIKEISYSAGYLHAPSFVRAFRNKFGTSPSDYRSGQQQGLRNSEFD